jgi:uncharacterized protein with PIN domain
MVASGAEQPRRPCFLAEATLGKLAKWLRLLGFDTIYHAGRHLEDAVDGCGKQRIVLTRTARVARKFSDRPVIFIGDDDPEDQLRFVAVRLGLTGRELAPFSRCLQCNRKTVPVSKDAARGKVPDYVWQTAPRFTACEGCRKIYWPGTHTHRAMARIRALFGDPVNS